MKTRTGDVIEWILNVKNSTYLHCRIMLNKMKMKSFGRYPRRTEKVSHRERQRGQACSEAQPDSKESLDDKLMLHNGGGPRKHVVRIIETILIIDEQLRIEQLPIREV